MSASSSHPPPHDTDLTARARIRKAALTEFARHGFRGASIRSIAEAAGVSPGLVQHHFGSKDGLQRACDAYVFETLQRSRTLANRKGALSQPGNLADLFAAMEPIIDYMMASVTSGSDTAEKWFNEIASYTHEILVSGDIGTTLGPEDDDRAIAAVHAAMGLGITVFYRQLRHILDDSRDDSDLMLRIGRARLFLASDRVIGEETRDAFQKGLDRFAQTHNASDKENGEIAEEKA